MPFRDAGKAGRAQGSIATLARLPGRKARSRRWQGCLGAKPDRDAGKAARSAKPDRDAGKLAEHRGISPPASSSADPGLDHLNPWIPDAREALFQGVRRTLVRDDFHPTPANLASIGIGSLPEATSSDTRKHEQGPGTRITEGAAIGGDF